ncbi:MAG: VOC family protein [Saprospirales bacterium]|nr:VOC family protein [Saprospirales bacterium]
MKKIILETRYVLAVKDLQASVHFYVEKLGFTIDWAQDGWHQLRREGIVVMLGECADDVAAFETRNHSYFAYILVDAPDALFGEFHAKGVEVLSFPTDKPWGMREFGIRTIDGHRITFGQELLKSDVASGNF